MVEYTRVMEMNQFNKLQECMREVEDASDFKGYSFRIGDRLSIIVCGMLCGLENVSEIHDLAKAVPTQKFLLEQLRVETVPCRAQFYNILACVDAEKFGKSFIKWMQFVLHGGTAGKTVSFDGKTIGGRGLFVLRQGQPTHDL